MIDQLTDQEKTDSLFQVMGWTVRTIASDIDSIWEIVGRDGESIYEFEYWGPKAQPIDLYELDTCGNPLYMFLAWRVLNWALKQEAIIAVKGVFWGHNEQESVLWDFVRWELWEIEEENQQRAIPDTILELATEAGLVVEEEKG